MAKGTSRQLLDHADRVRLNVAPRLPQARKSELGQFMTPASVARFMAAMFPPSREARCVLLDPGAGVGALSCAFLDRWAARDGLSFEHVELDAFEIDAALRGHLESVLGAYSAGTSLAIRVSGHDFIRYAALRVMDSRRFTHAILNPPYKKIGGASEHRQALRMVGIETVNLYSAFVALTLALMKPGGQVVAIIPRSFCNGPYYRPFRDFMFAHAALRQMHLFESRTKAFKDDDVLQENIIIRLERRGIQGPVRVSTSTDDTFSDLVAHEHPFERIVFPDDPERFIHVPTSLGQDAVEVAPGIRSTLEQIGVAVSTGPVVDFRLKQHIRENPAPATVPLLYPGHFGGQTLLWPKEGIKRGNALALNAETRKWLYPNGFYAVVRRFSSKEERRRIVASVVSPDQFPGAELLALENHLNVFHHGKCGLDADMAFGLAAFLNTTAVDEHFRRFNGHTQVNATDLRLMKYPDGPRLLRLGAWARRTNPTQAMLDKEFKKLAR